MTVVRIALANLPVPAAADESLSAAAAAVREAGAAGALVVCFPECYLPGYRRAGMAAAPPDAGFLERAWSEVGTAAGKASVAVVLGTERLVGSDLRATALVIDPAGNRLGFQDKVQLDPSEDGTYSPGAERRIFTVGPLTFGVAICHEGWRYPETVRWPVRHGAQVVFHPHYHWAEPGGFRPESFADPRNSFHEKALLCRAAENTCYVASVNYASAGAPTTSAVVDPEGNLVVAQPYGRPGLLLAELDLGRATGLLARRYRPVE